jgi:hypothetical protein
VNKNDSTVPVNVVEGLKTSLAKAPKTFDSLSLITKIEFFIPWHFLYKVLKSEPSCFKEKSLDKLVYWRK